MLNLNKMNIYTISLLFLSIYPTDKIRIHRKFYKPALRYGHKNPRYFLVPGILL